MTELNRMPCPFCGCDEDIAPVCQYGDTPDTLQAFVRCNNCSAVGPATLLFKIKRMPEAYAKAVEFWNRRPTHAPSSKELQRLWGHTR